MNKYRIVIEFETQEALDQDTMDTLLEDCSVQLESLDDGTYDVIVPFVKTAHRIDKI
jgi:hypothetical protein